MKKNLKRMLVLALVFSMAFSSLTVFASEAGGAPARLRIYGTDFKVEDGIVQGNYSKLVTNGDTISVKAVGDDFIGWIDTSNNKMMSRTAECDIKISGTTTYATLYNSATENTAYVEYVNNSDQVMQAETYGVDSVIDEPEVPVKAGYTNGRWTYTTQEILDAIASGETHIKVEAEYDLVEAYYDVTLVFDGDTDNPGGATDLANNSTYTAVAKEIEGKKFAYWSNAAENGDVLSYQANYNVKVSRDKILYAIYVDESETVIAEPTIGMSTVFSNGLSSDGKGNMSWETYREVPAGYTVVSHGVLRSMDATYSTIDTLTYANKDYFKYSSSTVTGYYVYNLAVPASALDTVVYIRPYMLVQKDGEAPKAIEAKTIWAYSYNQWVALETSATSAVAEPIAATEPVVASDNNSARLRIYGTSFKVGDGIVQSNYSKLVTDGDTITVTAVGDNFIGWMDASNNKIMSRTAQCDIKISGTTTYTTLYNSAAENTAYVEYVNNSDQVMQAETYGVDSVIGEPEVPVKAGYTNGRWTYTTQEILGAIASGETHIKVEAEYDLIEAEYNVTLVFDGDDENLGGATNLPNNSNYTAVAKDIEGKKFAYWSNAAENGDVLSYQANYNVKVSRNKILYAIYVDESETVTAEPTIGMSTVFSNGLSSDGKGNMSWETYREVPAGYTVVSHGVLRSMDASYSTIDTLTYANKDYFKYSSSTVTGYYVYNLAVPASALDTVVYIRPYMLVQKDGEAPKAIEANTIWAYSYNQWVALEASGELDVPVVPDKEPVQGTKEYPYDMYTTESETETVEIASGTSVYYNVYLNGTLFLSVNGADAYVVYNGERHNAIDGVVTVEISGSRWMPALVEIGNNGTDAKVYPVSFAMPVGTMGNPEIVDLGEHKATLEAGSQGYFYKYIAEEDGTLVITMKDANWTYSVNNLTSGVYGDTQWSDGDPVLTTYEVEVTAGDEIQIIVNTYDATNPWEAPAGEINWSIDYVVDGPGLDTEEDTDNDMGGIF